MVNKEVALTEKQVRALQCFCSGHNLKEIAIILNVSYSRIINLFSALLVKTGCRNRLQLLANAKEILNNQKSESEKAEKQEI